MLAFRAAIPDFSLTADAKAFFRAWWDSPSEHGAVMLIDADPQGSSLDWKAQRTVDGKFPVIGLPKPTLHREVSALGQHYDWIVIDGPPRGNELAKSAVAASDLVLIPVQPSPFDVWAAQDILDILDECRIVYPKVQARFVINRLLWAPSLEPKSMRSSPVFPFLSCKQPSVIEPNTPRLFGKARQTPGHDLPVSKPIGKQADHTDGASGGCHQGRPCRNPAPSTSARSNGTTSSSTASTSSIAP